MRFSSQVTLEFTQDKTPQGQLEVTAQRVDFIITKREQATDTGTDAAN